MGVAIMIYIIRHGQAEHNTDEPYSFNIRNPKLTLQGKEDYKKLRKEIRSDSRFWVSPTVRAIESAQLLSDENDITVVDILAPRIYPYKKVSLNPCDQMIPSDYNISLNFISVTDVAHPNDLNEEAFISHFKEFIDKYIDDDKNNVIITHDGVIATLLAYYKNIKLERDSNHDLMLHDDIFKFNKQDFLKGFNE